MTLRVFSDSRCLKHIVPQGFPEAPARLERLLEGLKQAKVEVHESGAHPKSDEAIAAVHSPEYLQRLRDAVASGDLFLDTGDNPLSAGTWEASRAAVDACLFAADWVAAGRHHRGFAIVRPPGHHAEHAMAMGFCYLNNVAVSTEYLIRAHGFKRVALVDFDVHHGNGTQHLFEERGDVFYLSVHQHPLFPGTGLADERGRGEGIGATLNIPLPAGTDDQLLSRAIDEQILPAIYDFRPDLMVVSAGFDAWQRDPVGGMRITAKAFADWGRWLRKAADDLCEGRIFTTLEGGYDLSALAALTVSYSRGMEEDL